jgi:hypothetical protein
MTCLGITLALTGKMGWHPRVEARLTGTLTRAVVLLSQVLDSRQLSGAQKRGDGQREVQLQDSSCVSATLQWIIIYAGGCLKLSSSAVGAARGHHAAAYICVAATCGIMRWCANKEGGFKGPYKRAKGCLAALGTFLGPCCASSPRPLDQWPDRKGLPESDCPVTAGADHITSMLRKLT